LELNKARVQLAVAEPAWARSDVADGQAVAPLPPAAMGNSQASPASASSSRFVMASRYHYPTNSLPATSIATAIRKPLLVWWSHHRDTLRRRAFSKQELDGLRGLFTSLAAQSQTSGRAISRSVFLVSTARAFAPLNRGLDLAGSGLRFLTGLALFAQEYYGVRGPLGDRLFQLVAKESGGSDGVTFEDLIISKVSAPLSSIHSVVHLVVASEGRVMCWCLVELIEVKIGTWAVGHMGAILLSRLGLGCWVFW